MIGTNKKDAAETVELLLEDAARRAARARADGRRSRRCSPSAASTFVEYAGWEAIDAHERARGAPHGRPRVKLASWDELLACAPSSARLDSTAWPRPSGRSSGAARRRRRSRTSRSPASRSRRPVARWLGRIKAAAARVNAELGLLDADKAERIAAAGDRIAAGELDDQFPIDVFQTGSGTSSNMNANEVIAALAGEDVHANDDVNMGQSSNDVFPSAVHLAALGELVDDLLPALDAARRVARGEGARVRRRRQVRPHALDGRRPGDARPGVRRLRGAGARRAARASRRRSPRLGQIPLGGTAVGTGLNTHPEFAARVRALLAERDRARHLGRRPIRSRRRRRATGSSRRPGALKVVAVSLTKIANDLRYLGSGPRAGLAEIFLPELQKGSSIMPGKVNPVIPEVVTQVAAQVIGNDAAITVGGLQGHFELNVFVPLMARNLLDSIKLLAARLPPPGREVRRRDRGEPRAVRALRRADALGRDGAQPVHRLRQGDARS